MQLSIVSTLYNSEPYLEEFYLRCKQSAESITSEFEIILVNDGSPDNSLQLAQQISKNDNRLIIINLSRNFGHQPALRKGMEKAQGEWVFMIDSDLEEAPEWLLDFWGQKSKETDVVYGIQQIRKGKWFEQWSGQIYYTMVNFLSPFPQPPNPVTARLMSKEYVDAINLYPESDTELWMIFAHAGFAQKTVPVLKNHKGATSYTFKRKWQLTLAMVTSVSNLPLFALLPIGLVMWLSTFVLSMFFLIKRDVHNFLLSFICLGISTVCVFVGVLAIYLAKIFNEVRHRPISIEKKWESKIK